MTTTAIRTDQVVTIRRATPADGDALARLAQLDSAPPLADDQLLVGELDGELLAALPLGSAGAIANPFRRTSGIVTMLETRRAEMRAVRAPSRRRLLGALWPSPAEG